MLVAFKMQKNTSQRPANTRHCGRPTMTNLLKLICPVVVVVALLGAGGFELTDDWDCWDGDRSRCCCCCVCCVCDGSWPEDMSTSMMPSGER